MCYSAIGFFINIAKLQPEHQNENLDKDNKKKYIYIFLIFFSNAAILQIYYWNTIKTFYYRC